MGSSHYPVCAELQAAFRRRQTAAYRSSREPVHPSTFRRMERRRHHWLGLYHRLERQARRHRPYALDPRRISEHLRHAGHRHRQAGVQGLVCNLLEVHRRIPNRPREWFLVPPAEQGQRGHRHRLARQVRPVPRHAVHTDPASQSGGFRRSGNEGQSERLTARNDKTSPFFSSYSRRTPVTAQGNRGSSYQTRLLSVCDSPIFSHVFTTI